MEKRKSERVKFFQLGTGNDMQHLWVFRKTYPEAILGLLIDITPEGAQLLTSKSEGLKEMNYRLFIHTDTEQEALTIDTYCCWSRPNGTLYNSNGLVFAEELDLQPILTSQDSRSRWLRCELLPLTQAGSFQARSNIEVLEQNN